MQVIVRLTVCNSSNGDGLKRICVYCGSSPGRSSIYGEAAELLGKALVAGGYELVYGGASVGTMGLLANAVLAQGGRVIGVMPAALVARGVAHIGLSELREVESMPQRKEQMASLADGFIALPGGLGTLDELFEVMTWAQLGMHHKPIGLVNTAGYFDGLLQFLNDSVREDFVRDVHRDMLLRSDAPETLLSQMEGWQPTVQSKWTDEPDVGGHQA